MNRICVIPGSFDPFTLGHLEIVKKASELFDKVYVAIMINSNKNSCFDFEERKQIAFLSCKELKNVEVITDDGLLCDLCVRLGARYIIKGIRDVNDYVYESELNGMNRLVNNSIQTLWIPTDSENEYVSSTFVRELLRYGKDPEKYLNKDAYEYIKKNEN